MSKIGNILGKGLKVVGHVAVGSLAFGLGTAATNWHPTGTVGLVWGTVGVALASGGIAALQRWAQFDPSKLGQ